MQSKTGFPSSHQLKSYVAPKSRLKFARRAVLSAHSGFLFKHTFAVIGDSLILHIVSYRPTNTDVHAILYFLQYPRSQITVYLVSRRNTVLHKHCVYFLFVLSCVAEPIEIPFGFRTEVGPGNHVLDGVQMPMGMGNFEGKRGVLL